MSRGCFLATAGAFAVAAACAVLYFPLTVDDAWIPLRYVHNLLEHGEWAFNRGERVNALTSTTHFLLVAMLQWTTGQALIVNKVVMAVLVLVSSALLAAELRWRPVSVGVVAVMLLASPFVWVWAVGGLETVLLLFLITLAVRLFLHHSDRLAFPALNLLGGIIFLTRYDAVVFLLPVLLAAWWRAYRTDGVTRRLLTGIGLAAFLPVVWLLFSLAYFHDIFPTSFYAKRSRDITLYKVEYSLQFLVMSGALPFLVAALTRLVRRGQGSEIRALVVARLPLVAGLALLLGYGLVHSTVHMMFGYRLFLPYLPVFVLLVAELLSLAAAPEERAVPSRRGQWTPCVLLVVFVCFQAAQAVFVYQRGLAGIGWSGEYRRQSVQTYQRGFVWAMMQGCEDIKRHASRQPTFAERAPRFLTFAEGYIPYCYPEMYTYGQLVSMRRPSPPPYASGADYVYVLFPRHGPVEGQLAYPLEDYEQVSSYAVEFDGRQEEFIIYFNPSPARVDLSSYVR